MDSIGVFIELLGFLSIEAIFAREREPWHFNADFLLSCWFQFLSLLVHLKWKENTNISFEL